MDPTEEATAAAAPEAAAAEENCNTGADKADEMTDAPAAAVTADAGAAAGTEKKDEEEGEDEEDEDDDDDDDDDDEDPHSLFPWAVPIQEGEDAQPVPPEIAFDDLAVFDIGFSPVDEVLAVGLVDGNVKMFGYSLEENRELLSCRAHTAACRCLTFTPDGKYLLSGSSDKSLCVMDVNTGHVVFSIKNAHKDSINAIAVNDKFIATGDDEGVIKLWDMGRRKCVQQWHEHNDYIASLLFHPHKNSLVAGGGDGCLSVWNTKKGQLQFVSDSFETELLSLSLTDTNDLVCGAQSGMLYDWSWGQWENSQKYPGHPNSVEALLYVSDTTILTGSSDGIIRVVQVKPFKFVGVLAEHGNGMPIERLRVDKDHRFLASTSHDECVRFFGVEELFQDSGEADEGEEEGEEEADKEEGEASAVASTAEMASSETKPTAMEEEAAEAEGDDDDGDSDSDSDESESGNEDNLANIKRKRTLSEAFYEDM
eukprot:TRINITY_DN8346_c0_g1_i1.p1 TRINITY_DN8346_c0_g1~~TRINITY_DN8346_c0_g1_i1.p1  ORF type:complete len:482 (-),score=162.94 TRINITY_DN8346_c0_g1_i1:139-1584(-)